MSIMRRLQKRSTEGSTTTPERAATVADELSTSYFAKVELEWKYRILDRLLKTVDLTLMVTLDEHQARTQIREVSQRLLDDESVPLSTVSRLRIIKQIEDEILGLGPLETLMADPVVSDILVNKFDSVYVERHGRIEATDVRFRDNQHLMNIIDRIVSRVGRRIDESSPMVDARLKDGSRVNAIIPPLAIDGPALSIRRFAVERLGMEDLIRIGSLSPPIAKVLTAIVRGRLNVLISGGTGSGKTTLLNILSGFIPVSERIVSIEDSAELQLQQPHVVRLEVRPPNIEQKGEVTQRDLLRNTLRMRPDRIIVGEVRAAEAFDMLQAMNTGHDGSLTTVHANTARDALSRLENMITMAGLNLPITAMRAQIASAINVILQLERMEDGSRRVVSVQEIQGMEGNIVTTSEIFKFQRRGVDDTGRVIGDYLATGLVPQFHDRLCRRGIELDFSLFNPNHRSE